MITALLDDRYLPGGWYAAVIRARATLQWDESGAAVHVCPSFGVDHALSKDCWCGPRPDEVDSRIFVHTASN